MRASDSLDAFLQTSSTAELRQLCGVQPYVIDVNAWFYSDGIQCVVIQDERTQQRAAQKRWISVTWHDRLHNFLPARRYASAVLAVIVCPSVRPSVCLSQVGVLRRWLNLGSRKQRHTIAVVFWHKQSLMGDAKFPLKLALKVTHPLSNIPRFRPLFAHSASTVRASEKCSISINRKSTTRFPTSYRRTVYVTPTSPKG